MMTMLLVSSGGCELRGTPFWNQNFEPSAILNIPLISVTTSCLHFLNNYEYVEFLIRYTPNCENNYGRLLQWKMGL